MFNDLLFSSNKFYHICHFLFLALTIIYVYVGFSYLTIRHSIIPFKLRSFIIHKLANSQPLANFQPQFLKYVYSPFVIIVNLKKSYKKVKTAHSILHIFHLLLFFNLYSFLLSCGHIPKLCILGQQSLLDGYIFLSILCIKF